MTPNHERGKGENQPFSSLTHTPLDFGDMKAFKPDRLIIIIAIVLLLIAIYFFIEGIRNDEQFSANLATEFLSIAITVLVIDGIYRWRDRLHSEELDERLAKQRKQEVIEQMGSPVNDAALEALRLAQKHKWDRDGTLSRIRLSNANLEYADFSHAHLEHSEFIATNLKNSHLIMANLENSTLVKADLENTHAIGAHLRGATLEGANLKNATLELADLEGASLGRANLENANLKSANLQHANLPGANLKGANLSAANLKNTTLTSVNLVGANLSASKLESANLSAANLQDSILSGADLSNANIKGEDLLEDEIWGPALHQESNVIPWDIILRQKNWNAQFENAKYNNKTKWPLKFDPKAAGAINVDKEQPNQDT